MVRAALISEGLSKAYGDIARTSDSLANRVRAIGGMVRELAIEFGQILEPYAKRAAAAVAGFLERISALPDGVKRAAVGFGIFLAALGPLSMALSALAATILPLLLIKMGPLFAVISAIVNPIGTAVVMAGKLIAEFGGLTAVVSKLGPVLLRFLGPVGLIIAAFQLFGDSILRGLQGLGVESTYEYSDVPALHAGTYAYGRYQNGKRVMGMGLAKDAIDWAVIAAWANVCEANGWSMFGVVYEPGDRWANLKDICFAGGADPVALGQLTFRYRAPTVALDTITEADLTDDDQSVMAMQSFRDRINTGIPKYRSPAHNWEMVDAEPVVNSTFLTEDGEEKRETWPCNFVTDEDQASQLVVYHIWDSRELAPITLVCKPRMRSYRPGECLHLDLPELGLDTTAIILWRELDPATMKVKLELMGETAAKHAYCLGLTGTAPPTPAIGQTAQDRDELAAAANGEDLSTLKISGSYTRGLAGNITQVHAGGSSVTVTIPDHVRVYADGTEVNVTGGTVSLQETTNYLLAYDDPDFAGGTIGTDLTVVAIRPGHAGATAGDAYFSAAHPFRHYLAQVTTVDAAGEGGGTGGSSPPGGGGWNGEPGTQIP